MTLLRTASDAKRLLSSADKLSQSPSHFEGTLASFFRDHAVHTLIGSDVVDRFHVALTDYLRDPDALALVRVVRGTERGRVYQTADGSRFKPTDNAPAWWLHAALVHGGEIEPGWFSAVIETMPSHLFGVAKTCAPTANTAGWHVAHIFPVKDGDTDFVNWSGADVVRRFVRNIHPCNYFFIPKAEWQRWGGDPHVIAFFAAEYRAMYASAWESFLALADAEDLGDAGLAGELVYSYSSEGSAAADPGGETRVRSLRLETHAPDGVVQYSASRLTFKRDVIEPLGASGIFRIVTPVGTFEMSKEDFCRAFPNVRLSRSYRDAGMYHYPTPPRVAGEFRIS